MRERKKEKENEREDERERIERLNPLLTYRNEALPVGEGNSVHSTAAGAWDNSS